MAKIRITDLSLRTIIGLHDWERKNKQDILINVLFDYDCTACRTNDRIEDAVDYRSLTKKIITEVESSNFFLLEKLTAHVLKIVMDIPRIQSATVRIDKPQALRFARSVSVELSDQR